MIGSPRPTGRELIAEVRDVLRDVPIFLTAPLYRRWHLHWGATPAEVTSKLPGDGLMRHAQYRSTRAITIDSPPDAVWPWLVQVGCLRGGWYSNDLLDNLAHPSATTTAPTGSPSMPTGSPFPMAAGRRAVVIRLRSTPASRGPGAVHPHARAAPASRTRRAAPSRQPREPFGCAPSEPARAGARGSPNRRRATPGRSAKPH
jgi:hypothetical protein